MSTGTVTAFDTADGTEHWQTQLGGVIRNIAIANGVVYALSDGNNAIYALDAATGEQLGASRSTAGSTAASP